MSRTVRTRLHALATSIVVVLLLMGNVQSPVSAVINAPVSEAPQALESAAACERELKADVVALDQPIVYNRLGTYNPVGMIYALKGDVVHSYPKDTDPDHALDGKTEQESRAALRFGKVRLREDKRPRPLTLRMNVGDCLTVNFQNLLSDPATGDQPVTRNTGFHVSGMQLHNANGISNDGSNVGDNPSSLVAPGDTRTYTFYAEREGTYLLNSPVDNVSAESIGTQAFGLFGAVNVEPRGAEWYRSQVTQAELNQATTGTTADGHPIINYDAVYPAEHRYAGLPILKMLDGNQIVHSDLTAIITGPSRGPFSPGTYPPNPSYPNRNQPFREFTLVFHDEIKAIQAFPIFADRQFEFTLHSVRDGFAINYGTGGVGAEIVANRFGVGPMWDCVECKYEEFFLTSWAVGDPAMVVDVPANANLNADGKPKTAGPQATKALYPEDPSNVYHSYLNDHVKFRNLHVGKEHHIFHLHAHQWLSTPDDDNSSYLDSQAIGPSSGYTYEIAYNGSGNRNKTVGDSIFHCHFYPHFAQGMWALWRVHDTFERGTELDASGSPIPGARALPDGEIAAGTPIPGLVPIPTNPMAPMPGNVTVVDGSTLAAPLPGSQISITEPDANGDGKPDRNVGFPFFIASVAGHRPPTPPLDLIDDGGLPRHVITGGTAHTVVTPLDFSRELLTARSTYYPEDGTAAEKAAMDFHQERWHATYKPDGTSAQFETNGLPPNAGAPYAEPCRSDDGQPTGSQRVYKGADIQFDMKINKVGWHTPQARILALWDDVQSTLNGTRTPEPLVLRANTGDCISYYHTNLVPNVYEQDAFQVRTPTDVIGQHIHLVKFDVTSADGSGNGWNYEDGTMSPDEVRERIKAIRAWNSCDSGSPTGPCPEAKAHPFFGSGPDGKWLGARTTIQRWYADPVVNKLGEDRTLGNVYTHDHYGPSTHQQTGLYATLIIEPQGSSWRDSEHGGMLGRGRFDGGPTSWRADILTQDPKQSFREFYLEFQDFHLAYEAGRGIDAAGKPIPDPMGAINPPGIVEDALPGLVKKPEVCPNGQPFIPDGCPEAISAADVGTFSVNYRSEPIALRVRDRERDSSTQRWKQAPGPQGDLSLAFSSLVERADPALNVQPTFYPPPTKDVQPKDPFTPLLRAYDNDRVRIRLQVGATEEGHNASIHGVKWLQEYDSPNSGWRNSQMMGISEQFIFDMPITPIKSSQDPNLTQVDRLYMVSSAVEGLWQGNWGLLRSYPRLRNDLLPLPSNPMGQNGLGVTNFASFDGACPITAPVRNIGVTAVLARDALPNGTLVYNPRPVKEGPLHDPTAILYVRTGDLNARGKLKSGVPVEPLILRARAGECIKLTLQNKLPAEALPDLPGWNLLPAIVDGFNANDIRPSNRVGLHPQLVAYDVTTSDGADVGLNPTQTVAPGGARRTNTWTYTWYAGDVQLTERALVARPMEFGAINLISSDKIKHTNKGAIGALIVEPQGATWVEDAGGRASATVTRADGTTFRDFVLLFQDDLNLRLGNGSLTGNGAPLPIVAGEFDPEDAGGVALNYRTEPLWLRLGIDPAAPETTLRTKDFTNALSNSQIGGDPVTPVFTARAGQEVRLRVLQPGGHFRNHVFNLHGHVWERYPYTNGSTQIGSNPLSEWKGSQEGHGPTDHWDIVPKNGAGGKFRVTGDYLYRDMTPMRFYQGLWGIFRVTP